MKRALILTLSALYSSAAVSNVQPVSNDTIVVTGKSIAEARREAKSYLRELGVANGNRQQAARWLTAVCPKVLGLNEDQARRIEARIRSVTKQVGAPLAGASCDSNLVVVFTSNADAMIERLGNSPPGRLGLPGSTTARRLKSEQAPVRWWYNVGVQSNFGVATASDLTPAAKFVDYFGNEAPPPGNTDTTTLHHYSASLLSTRSARGIYAATLVVDSTRINPVSVRSIADYAALVGLAEINFGASPEESVLSLFSPQGSPRLTDRDLSFLNGLYRMTMDREVNLQRQMLVNEIVRPRKRVAVN